jgi:hypothetical protein
MRHLRWWFERGQSASAQGQEERELLSLIHEIETDLREIDFEEVTSEDRVILVEREVIWQVRCALARGRFDLALALQRFAVRRIADLRAAEGGFRPMVIHGDRGGRTDPVAADQTSATGS